jgi:hypothetical protein
MAFSTFNGSETNTEDDTAPIAVWESDVSGQLPLEVLQPRIKAGSLDADTVSEEVEEDLLSRRDMDFSTLFAFSRWSSMEWFWERYRRMVICLCLLLLLLLALTLLLVIGLSTPSPQSVVLTGCCDNPRAAVQWALTLTGSSTVWVMQRTASGELSTQVYQGPGLEWLMLSSSVLRSDHYLQTEHLQRWWHKPTNNCFDVLVSQTALWPSADTTVEFPATWRILQAPAAQVTIPFMANLTCELRAPHRAYQGRVWEANEWTLWAYDLLQKWYELPPALYWRTHTGAAQLWAQIVPGPQVAVIMPPDWRDQHWDWPTTQLGQLAHRVMDNAEIDEPLCTQVVELLDAVQYFVDASVLECGTESQCPGVVWGWRVIMLWSQLRCRDIAQQVIYHHTPYICGPRSVCNDASWVSRCQEEVTLCTQEVVGPAVYVFTHVTEYRK